MMKKILVTMMLFVVMICSNYINVYGALNVDDMDRYKSGDKFKIVKSSYVYKVTYSNTGILFWKKKSKVDINEPKSSDRTGETLSKNTVVTYTGKFGHVHGKSGDDAKYYYLQVKSGNITGYINAYNVETYKTKVPDRPKTITDFINKNGIAGLSDKEYNSKIKAFKNSTNDAAVLRAIESVGGQAEEASAEKIMNYDSRESAKAELEKQYKEALGYPYMDPDDVQFMASAYIISHYYNALLKADEEYGKDDGSNKNTNWTEQFDKAYKNYKNAKTDAEKDAALAAMNKAWEKMTDAEKKEKPSGETKTRAEMKGDVGTEEGNRAEDNYKQQQKTENKDGEYYSNTIYSYPEKTGSSAGSLDDMIGDADKFLDSSTDPAIKSSSLQDFSNKFYNILLTVGIIIAVIVGMVLGIKFMAGSVEEKANIKEILVPYIVGCVVIFGAFAIWKLVVTILSSSLV